MKKLNVFAAALLAVTVLAGCGSSADSADVKPTEIKSTETQAAGAPASASEDKVIKVGATAVPHAMVLNDVVKGILAEEGWELEVVEFTDYVTPNTSLEEGELDANYFQTYAYLVDQNETRNLHLKEVLGVHYEPMQIFSKAYTDVAQISEQDIIAIPNDFDNEKRALSFAADEGIIEYDPELAVSDGSPLDGITANPKNIEFKEVEAANVPQANDDVNALIVNGNYALESKIKDKANSIAVEVPDIEARTNYLVVKEGSEETEKTKALIKAIANDRVKEYITENYGSAVVPVF